MGKDKDLERTIKEVLKEIPQDYRDKNFSHIAIVANALKRDRPEHVLKRLDEYYTNLNEAVTDIVDVNFHSFNQSIKNFSDILNNLNQSQKKIESLEKDIEDCKDLLTSRATDLKQLYENYLQHTEFLNILKQVEEVKSVPDQLNQAIETKHYLYAVKLILKYSEVLKRPQLRSIKALNSIRTRLVDIQSDLPDTLVEELNRHIYNGEIVSRSTISDILSMFNRNMGLNLSEESSGNDSSRRNEVLSPGSGEQSPGTPNSRLSMRMRMNRILSPKTSNEGAFSSSFDMNAMDRKDSESDTLLEDDLSIDPEFDSHYFLMLIIETLYKLDRLGEVQSRLIQSLRYELRSLIENHIAEYANNLETNQLKKASDSSNGSQSMGDMQFSSLFDGLNKAVTISPEEKSNILWTIIQSKKMTLSSVTSESDADVVKKAVLQGTLLSECLNSLFAKMTGVLWNFKFVVDVMEMKFKKDKKPFKHTDSDDFDDSLNIKLTPVLLSRVRDTVRLKLDDLRNNPRSDPVYLSALEDLLYNFIDKTASQFGMGNTGTQRTNTSTSTNPTLNELKVRKVPEMFTEMVNTQIKLKAADDPSASIRASMITQDFQASMLHTFKSADGARLLTGSHVWKTIQNELKTVLKDVLGVTAEEMEFFTSGGFNQEASPISTALLTSTPLEKKKKKKKGNSEYRFRFRFGTNIESVMPVQNSSDDRSAAASDQKAGFSKITVPLLNYFFFTPYNMIWMYRLVREFCSECQQIVGNSSLQNASNNGEVVNKIFDSFENITSNDTDALSEPKVDILQEFMVDSIQHSLIARVRRDYRAKITEMLQSNDAFRPKEFLYTKTNATYSGESKFRPLLSSAVSLSQWISELYQFANAIPPNRSEFFSIMEILLKRYLDECRTHFDEKMSGKYVWDCLMNRTDLLPILELDREWQSLYVSSLASDSNSMFPKLVTTTDIKSLERRMEEMEVDLFTLDHNLVQHTNMDRVLIMDRASSTILLCNLNDSLEWLADQISQMSKSSFSNSMEAMMPRSQSFSSFIGMASPKITPAMYSNETLKDYYRKYKLLANQCLFALKIDIRAHCYFFLSDIKNSVYECEEEASEPEYFVTQFNTDMQQLQRYTVTYLPINKKNYLFQGIAPLVAKILIFSLPKIKHQRFNKNGVAKMGRNIFALQQNITSITHSTMLLNNSSNESTSPYTASSPSMLDAMDSSSMEKNVYFYRVRLYYSLLGMTIKELFAHLRSDDVLLYLYNEYGEMYSGVDLFSLEEYLAVLETKFTTEDEPQREKDRNIVRSLYEQMQQEVADILADNHHDYEDDNVQML